MISAIQLRIIGVVAAILAVFVIGHHFGAKGVQNEWNEAKQAQSLFVMQKIQENAAKLNTQIAINRSIEADNEKIKADNAVSNTRLLGSLRLYAKLSTSPVPGFPEGSGAAPATGEEPGCTRHISDLVEHAASVFESARSDATQLTLLQRWVRESGLD